MIRNFGQLSKYVYDSQMERINVNVFICCVSALESLYTNENLRVINLDSVAKHSTEVCTVHSK